MSLSRYLEWRTAAQRFGCRPWELSGEEQAAVNEQAVRERRVIELALAAPEAQDVRADPEAVEAGFAALAEGSADQTSFLAEITRGGLDQEGLREALAAELRAGMVLEGIGAEVTIDESAVHAYYARQRERLVLPEQRAARHILITINEDDPENRREIASRRIHEAAGALAAGADFAALAEHYSECPSALQGGTLGQVRRGQLFPELESALFRLRPGEVEVVESPLGFHLVRCDAVIPPQPISFEAAAPSIRRKLESSARQRAQRAWLTKREISPGA